MYIIALKSPAKIILRNSPWSLKGTWPQDSFHLGWDLLVHSCQRRTRFQQIHWESRAKAAGTSGNQHPLALTKPQRSSGSPEAEPWLPRQLQLSWGTRKLPFWAKAPPPHVNILSSPDVYWHHPRALRFCVSDKLPRDDVPEPPAPHFESQVTSLR